MNKKFSPTIAIIFVRPFGLTVENSNNTRVLLCMNIFAFQNGWANLLKRSLCNERKSFYNTSIIWRAVTNRYPLIYSSPILSVEIFILQVSNHSNWRIWNLSHTCGLTNEKLSPFTSGQSCPKPNNNRTYKYAPVSRGESPFHGTTVCRIIPPT